jgi:hypothetical protein
MRDETPKKEETMTEIHRYDPRTYTNQHEAGVELDRRVKRFMADNPTVKDYETAMDAVLDADADLKLAYADAPPPEHG